MPAQSFELGGVLVERAERFLAEHPGAEDALRRIFTLRLATVREDGEPNRRRADRSEFSDAEWRLVSELADYPYRLLVTVGTATGQTHAEVAHEAIFRRWDRLRQWIAQEREFLIWHSGLEAARRAWQAAPQPSKRDAVLMGLPLEQARHWLEARPDDVPAADRAFIMQSRAAAQQRRRRVQALVVAVAICEAAVICIGLFGWLNRGVVEDQWRLYTRVNPYIAKEITPYVLTAAAERTLKPGDSFRECAKDCPPMILVPAGSFKMGSPPSEAGRAANEGPQHVVTIAKPFAVAKFEVSFADWDACVRFGDCSPHASDSGWGRGQRPAINVNWNDAQQYVGWLRRTTGKPYRLLSEAEYEYAARAGTATAYPWGNQIGTDHAACNGCGGGSGWGSDEPQTVTVGSFQANPFGLYDMVGNVWEWVADCWHANYAGAPVDGSAWRRQSAQDGTSCPRVIRGGSWRDPPPDLRVTARKWYNDRYIDSTVGFRIARTLER